MTRDGGDLDWSAIARAIRDCDRLVVSAGAGLGVDGGLGADRRLESDPIDPRVAWAFWKDQMEEFHSTQPHEGYRILNRWLEAKGTEKSFVFTSNIDGHFRRLPAVGDNLLECHGTVNFLQCSDPERCLGGDQVWETDFDAISRLTVDKKQRINEVPLCPACGRVARPAVLGFCDLNWSNQIYHQQSLRFEAFLSSRQQDETVVLLEMGARTTIPTVRLWSEGFAEANDATFVRINPEFPAVPKLDKSSASYSLAFGALEALKVLEPLVRDGRALRAPRSTNDEPLRRAAKILHSSDILLIAAGAGLGVDGGLGTFRGSAAAAWPGLAHWGIDFPHMSCPDRFLENDRYGGPRTAWAFWKWRADAYSQAEIHQGYHLLRRWAKEKGPDSAFVFTSNIDGHFRRLGGFEDHLVECHGTLDFLQCQDADSSRACPQGDAVWPTPFAEIAKLEVDPKRFQVQGRLPLCPGCGKPARPAVLMFGDMNCSHTVIGKQQRQLDRFLSNLKMLTSPPTVAILELGAGVAIPTVRRHSEFWTEDLEATLIRVNPEQAEVPSRLASRAVSLKMGALEALTKLEEYGR